MVKSIILFDAIFNEKSMAISIVSNNIADSDIISLVNCQKSTIRMMDGNTVNRLCMVFSLKNLNNHFWNMNSKNQPVELFHHIFQHDNWNLHRNESGSDILLILLVPHEIIQNDFFKFDKKILKLFRISCTCVFGELRCCTLAATGLHPSGTECDISMTKP